MAQKSTRLGALHNTFEENGISPDTIELNDTLLRNIKKHADAVPDYSHPSYTKHLLGDIIMLVFFAILGNADEWEEIESFAKRQPGEHGEARALQTLNVYSNDHGICLAQKFISEKTNEIPAAQELLRLMDLWDTIVTADAMNCQKEAVSAIASDIGSVFLLNSDGKIYFSNQRDLIGLYSP